MLSLLTLKNYLQKQQRVSLQQLALQFKEDSALIEGMLSHFIRKGQLRECRCEITACKRCPLQCRKQTVISFEWLMGT
ncbi:MAG: FeoC like transcriptional regulator [Gammaproteobacteria bacterium]|jgi:hypothetical protein|nr:FeoC like transcriptional regulator [Gammaproteobacteria bacterium]